MNITLFYRAPNTYVRPICVLQVAMDTKAERLFVIDRNSFEVVWACTRPPSSVAKVQLPSIYASTDNLLVGILDDDRNYNVKAADGVRCEMVTSNFDMSQ